MIHNKIGRYLLILVVSISLIFMDWLLVAIFNHSLPQAEAAISGVTARGSSVTGTGNSSSHNGSPSATITVGKIFFVAITTDNEGTSDGCGGALHSLSDTAGNAWYKIFECVETDGAGNDGNATSLFITKVTTQINTSDVITVTFGSTRSDVIMSFTEVTFSAGKTYAIQTFGIGQNSLSASVSGMTSREYLLLGVTGAEGEDTSKTPGTNYTERHDLVSTTAGQADTNVAQHVQSRIATLTSDTVSSSAWTFTNAIATLTAIYEIDDPTFEQSVYKWFNNTDSTDVGSQLADADTAATLASSGAAFRLRALIHLGGTGSIMYLNGHNFKLQFAARSGTCDTGFSGESYADVTGATVIAFNNNSTPADGDNLTSNASDPAHSGHTIVNQDYEEANNFSNTVANIPTGQDGKWDFALIDNGAPSNTTYCLRIVKSNGTLLNTYTVIPEITTASSISLTLIVTTDPFPNITPNTPVFATSTISVDTNNSTGWFITLTSDDRDSSGNTTMDLNTDAAINIPDLTPEWISPAATTTAGNAIQLTAGDDGLSFRVMTASGTISFISSDWWGSNDSPYTTARWAGLASSTAPTANTKVGISSIDSGGAPVLSTVQYYLDVPLSQQNGAYSGNITYTATAN